MTPIYIETAELANYPDAVLIDLSDAEQYAAGHIDGARHMAYNDIVRGAPPVGGLIAEVAALEALLGSLGISNTTHIIAYDEQGGAKSGRFMNTLDYLGHANKSVINGGLNAWVGDGLPLSTTAPSWDQSTYSADTAGQTAMVDSAWIQSKLDDDSIAFLDARSAGEFSGAVVRSAHGGHLPGAKHLEWTDALDRENHLRLKADETLQGILDARGIRKDQTVVVYCQTHHRSGLSYWMLKHLGYDDVRGYPGAWSDWGNNAELPKEL